MHTFTSTSRPRLTPRIIVFLVVIAVLVGYPVYVYIDSVVSGGIKSHGDVLAERRAANKQARRWPRRARGHA